MAINIEDYKKIYKERINAIASGAFKENNLMIIIGEISDSYVLDTSEKKELIYYALGKI